MKPRKILKFTIGLPLLIVMSLTYICVSPLLYLIIADETYKEILEPLLSFWED